MNEKNEMLDILSREGVLINITVSYPRFHKKLTADEIGFSDKDISESLISLGHKKLAPKEALASFQLIESRTRSMIDAHTFPFLKGLAHFVPNNKLPEVDMLARQLEDEFWSARERFLDNYETNRTKWLADWREQAKKLKKPEDVERFVAKIDDAFPARHKVERCFSYRKNLFQISLPERLRVEGITFEQQMAVAAVRDKVARETEEQLKAQAGEFVADCVATLREQAGLLASEMLDTINNCETGVHQKTLNRLKDFIDRFKALNFARDKQFEDVLSKARLEILSKSAEQYRDNEHFRGELVANLSKLRDQAKEMAGQDASDLVANFGEMGKRKFNLVSDDESTEPAAQPAAA